MSQFNLGWIPLIQQELRKFFASKGQGDKADTALQPGAIGTTVQAYDADLTAIAGLATTGVIERTGAGTATTFTVTANAKQLLDDSTFAAMRTTLELGSISTQSANNVSITGGSVSGITDLAIADGGTGASTAPQARTNLGATAVGSNLFTLPNPSAITFPRLNADNSVSALSAADFRTAISAQPLGTDLTAIAALTTTGLIDRTGAGTAATRATGATGLAVLAAADAATARTAINAAPLASPTFTGTVTAPVVGIGTASPSNRLSVRGGPGPDGHSEDLVEISTSANSYSVHAKLILSGFVGDTGPAFIGGLRPPSGDVNLNSLTLGAGGSERMRIHQDGNVGIGTTSPTRKLDVRGQGLFQNGLVVTDGSVVNPPSQSLIHLRKSDRNNGISWNDSLLSYAGFIQTVAGVLELGGRQNGSTQADNTDPQIRIYDRGVDFPSISTTASGANAFLSGTPRRLLVSTSSLRYKKDIEPVEETYADAILDLQAVYYRSKSLVDNPDWSWWGFIAEDVFKVDPRLVTYIEDPEDPDKLIPDGVQYDRISVLLQDIVKRQSLKISELENRIATLEQSLPS